MFALKHKAAALAAVGALALGVPAVSLAASPTPVSSIVAANSGVLGAAGPLGQFGPLGGRGCVSSNVNPNSLGMDGPLGPNGPLGPGGFLANFQCSGGLNLFGAFPFFLPLVG